MKKETGLASANGKPQIGTELVHPGGRSVTFVHNGIDERGEFLVLEHRMPYQGALNGPHWHPELEETFTVREGRMRFLVDGRETTLGPGEQLTVKPRQVHQFWNISEDKLVAVHEIRPPGLHWKMFVLMLKLELEGKLNGKGIPRNPLWLGVAWECIDGYLEGPPRFLQRIVLGGLAKLAKRLGYTI